MKRLLKTTNIFQLRIGMGLGLKIERTETFIFSNDIFDLHLMEIRKEIIQKACVVISRLQVSHKI